MIGKAIGAYQIEETIGAGAMSTVFKARDAAGGPVAIKLLHGHLAQGESRERFMREARVLASLADPRCIKILQPIVEEGSQVYSVLEYIEGQSLAEFVRSNGPFPPLFALFLVREILYPLAEAHEKGIVHRDLKPENILIGGQGQIKVADFGLARLADRTGLTRPGAVIGSPAFMSPEQVLGKKADGRADLFSLGVIHYNLLTGRLLFEGKTKQDVFHAILSLDPAPALDGLGSLDAEYLAVLNRCLAKDRDQRFPSARQLGISWDAYLEGRGLADYHPALTSYLQRPQQDPQTLARLLADGLLHRAGALLSSGREAEALPLVRKGLELAGYLELTASGTTTARLLRRGRGWPGAGRLAGGILLSALLLGGGYFLGQKLSAPVPISTEATAPRPLPSPAVAPAARLPEKIAEEDPLREVAAIPTATPTPQTPPASPPVIVEPVSSAPATPSAVPAMPPPVKAATPSPRPGSTLPAKTALENRPPRTAAVKGEGYLKVRTTPWAYVFIDGKFYGETPFDFPLTLAAGRHRLVLKNPFCQTSELELLIRPGETQQLEHRLEILPAVLTWRLPVGYRLAVDGQETAGNELSLSHGLHQLRLSAPDGKRQETSVELKAGQRLRVGVGSEGITLTAE